MKVLEICVELDVSWPDKEPYYHAWIPQLKGLHTGGATVFEAVKNASVALPAYLRSVEKHGDIPDSLLIKLDAE